MRVSAEQITAIQGRMLDESVELVDIEEGKDGRLLVRAVEVVERTRPLKLSKAREQQHSVGLGNDQ